MGRIKHSGEPSMSCMSMTHYLLTLDSYAKKERVKYEAAVTRIFGWMVLSAQTTSAKEMFES
jgi:ribosomal protein L23